MLADPRRARIAAWLLLILGMAFCRGAYLENVIYNIDEAEYAVAADALDHGWLPGVDLLGSTKPPGIAVLYNLLFHIFGRSLAVIHVAHLVIIIFAGALAAEIAGAVWEPKAILPAALLFWMASNSFAMPDEILALNVESPGVALALVAIWLVWKKARARWAVMGSGMALGGAILFRQSFVFFAIPAVYAIFNRWRWRGLIRTALGLALVWIPVLLVYALRGGLSWPLDSWIRYPLTYAADLGWSGFLEAFWRTTVEFSQQEFVPLLLAMVGLLAIWRDRRAPRGKFVLLLLVASVLALTSGSRFFGHYWIQLFPAVALLGVAGWIWLAERTKVGRRVLLALVIFGALLALRHFPLWREWDPWAAPAGFSPYALGQSEADKTLGQFAASHTKPSETIVVWGYCPQIYYHAHRLPGVRDYLCHYTTGYSPATFSPNAARPSRAFGHPRAPELFVEDLKQRHPKYILDIAPIRDYEFPFFQYPMRSYLPIADFVRSNYLPETSVAGALIYRLRTPADSTLDVSPQYESSELQ